MRFTVTYEVEIDGAAWAHEYGSDGPREVAAEVSSDIRNWMHEMFKYPKWEDLATVAPHDVRVTLIEEEYEG